jgi:DNA modification methylase
MGASGVFRHGKAVLHHADCFEWLAARKPDSVHAVVTDPPYGVLEYTAAEVSKLRGGRGGVWRIPPSLDGHRRAPLPRFTVLGEADRERLREFFHGLGALLARVVVPGGNIIVASNPLLCHVVASAMAESGLEPRGYLARLTMTLRGGDRPKNAHVEFDGVSVMPRSQWEPWVLLRRAPDGRIQDNLRRWQTGGFRRPSAAQPFGDVIRSSPTTRKEKTIAPHPSLKPQQFLRQVVRASLPLGDGIVLDPFAGSASTLAAANAVGYSSIGIERDASFMTLARTALPALSAIEVASD